MNTKDVKHFFSPWLRKNAEYFETTKTNSNYRKRRDINYDESLINGLHDTYSPIFVLSTGRCGTEYLTRLLKQNDKLFVSHSPIPEFIYYSNYAYQNFKKKHLELIHIFDAARIETILEVYLRDRIFIETNNRITFFAYAIASLYPKSKFIHLIRHPGSFVRSGIRRKWYQGVDRHDIGRIIPVDDFSDWNRLSDIEKIGWLWNETNTYIDDFKNNLKDKNRVITVKAEDLFNNLEIIKIIYEFVGSEKYPEKKIGRIANKKINAQTDGNFPKFSNWQSNDKEHLKNICPIAEKYDYSLDF